MLTTLLPRLFPVTRWRTPTEMTEVRCTASCMFGRKAPGGEFLRCLMPFIGRSILKTHRGPLSLLYYIRARAVTYLDGYVGHCYNRTKWPRKLPHNTAKFAVLRGSGYRICSERYSMTFWLLFNVYFEKFNQLLTKSGPVVDVVSERSL